MLFNRLGVVWAGYKGHLEKDLRTLVVDDEQVICGILERLLKREGFVVDTALDAEAAWELIQNECFDLLVTDKNLPGRSGLELIAQVKQAGLTLPSVMITGHPTVTSLADAVSQGAADYIGKPFQDVKQVIRRLKSVVDQRVCEQLYTRVIRDFTEAAKSSGEDKALALQISQELFQYKQTLAARPQVLLLEPNRGLAEVASDALMAHGVTVEVQTRVADAKQRLFAAQGPLTAVIDLRVPGAVEFIGELKRQDPLVEVLATSAGSDLASALLALEAGAVDFMNRLIEGMDVLQMRVGRLVNRAQRQRLYVHLVALLYRRAKQQDPETAAAFAQVLPAEQRDYMDRLVEQRPLKNVPDAVDVDELFGEKSPRDRLPRVKSSLPIRYHLRGQPSRTARGATHDLSETGMFIRCQQTLPLGTRLRLELADDHLEQAVATFAEVVRFVKIEPDPRGASGLGVRILGPFSDYKKLVNRLFSLHNAA